jgi:hypothetical protein
MYNRGSYKMNGSAGTAAEMGAAPSLAPSPLPPHVSRRIPISSPSTPTPARSNAPRAHAQVSLTLPPLASQPVPAEPVTTPKPRTDVAFNAAELEAVLTAVLDVSPFMASTKKSAKAWDQVKKKIHTRGVCLRFTDTATFRNKLKNLLEYKEVRASLSIPHISTYLVLRRTTPVAISL